MPLTLPYPDFLPGAIAKSAEIDANFAAIKSFVDAISGSAPVNPMEYGAIADGGTHPLSTRYASLAAAQAVYPFATSLTQQIDYCAIKQASDVAFGATGSEHGSANARLNRPFYLPAGNYFLGNDTWKISYGTGLRIYGDGRLSTTITGNDIVMLFDGLWYSSIEGIGFQTNGGVTAVDLDGHVGGTTRATQACTFKDCLFQAASTSSYAFAVCRTGGSGAQGSENVWINCHWFGTGSNNSALLSIYGFNALQNTVIGGNFQVYGKQAIRCAYGSVEVYSVGFQSTTGYTQVVNDGYDIDCNEGGANAPITVIGCRTESLRFFRGIAAQPPVLIGNCSIGGGVAWVAGFAYTLNMIYQATAPDGKKHWYRVTTAGTSGGVEPTWPNSGTVADGGVVWTETTVDVVHMNSGVVMELQNYWDDRHLYMDSLYFEKQRFSSANASLNLDTDETLFIDTSGGNRTVSLPSDALTRLGKKFTVKKTTTDANTVTISGPRIDGVAAATAVIPGGSRGYVTFKYGLDIGEQLCAWIISKSF